MINVHDKKAPPPRSGVKVCEKFSLKIINVLFLTSAIKSQHDFSKAYEIDLTESSESLNQEKIIFFTNHIISIVF